jgi:hypothetical protein
MASNYATKITWFKLDVATHNEKIKEIVEVQAPWQNKYKPCRKEVERRERRRPAAGDATAAQGASDLRRQREAEGTCNICAKSRYMSDERRW